MVAYPRRVRRRADLPRVRLSPIISPPNSGFLILSVHKFGLGEDSWFLSPILLASPLDSGRMEGGSGFDGATMKRRRSSAVRRPRPEGGPATVQRDNSVSSPPSSSRSGSRRLLVTSDENAAGVYGGQRRREFLLNAPSPESATKGSIRLRFEAASGGARKAEGSSHVAQPEGNCVVRPRPVASRGR